MLLPSVVSQLLIHKCICSLLIIYSLKIFMQYIKLLLQVKLKLKSYFTKYSRTLKSKQ